VAVYDLERLSVFLVEDNRYVSNTLEDLLRQLRFGRILTAANGAEAIEHLKTMHENPQMAASLGLDVFISDLVMAPVNGLLLLRWMRSAKESPNRFVPFIMLSGGADAEYVHAARDLGVTEFLAKPFSVGSVSRHILEAIDYPRQFVASNKYYGPDRRRRNGGTPAEERRMMKEEDITIVYSADKVVKPKKATDVWYFRLPNALKDKVGGMGTGGPGELPTELLEEAEEQLERAALDFTEWARDYLAKLSDLCTDALMRPGRRNKHFEEINLLAHELRGQGGTFGYPLISVFGKMLYEATREGCSESDSAVEIVKTHINTMRAVLREKIAGDGGEVGRALHKSLKAAIDKHTMVA
jgi:CheY-like chemotaxis protein